MVDSAAGINLCPEHIAVIGGGRWARVLATTLCDIVPAGVDVSVHSSHNADAMSAWVLKQGFKQNIQVSSDWPPQFSSRPSAVIVVNAARDHEMAVEWALSEHIPVLVEKPIALNAGTSERLANLAHSQNVYFAAAHIFLFTGYLGNFAKLVAEAGDIRSLRVSWMDPLTESRYGEPKHYDPGLPVFADCLPHVLSMLGALLPNLIPQCEQVTPRNGGAHVVLDLMLGNIPCSVQLARNADQRQRIIEVATDQETLKLDFSIEPGTITAGATTSNADPDWEIRARPSATMLTAFLEGAVDGARDPRLNIEIGLLACKVIDQTSIRYNSSLMPWLLERLASQGQVDDDLRYAISEMLQSERTLPVTEIDQRVGHLQQQFAAKAVDANWLKTFTEAEDPATILRSM